MKQYFKSFPTEILSCSLTTTSWRSVQTMLKHKLQYSFFSPHESTSWHLQMSWLLSQKSHKTNFSCKFNFESGSLNQPGRGRCQDISHPKFDRLSKKLEEGVHRNLLDVVDDDQAGVGTQNVFAQFTVPLIVLALAGQILNGAKFINDISFGNLPNVSFKFFRIGPPVSRKHVSPPLQKLNC